MRIKKPALERGTLEREVYVAAEKIKSDNLYLQISEDEEALKNYSVAELARNDIEMAENGFQFDRGDLDWYFAEFSKTIPYFYLSLLEQIKREQGI